MQDTIDDIKGLLQNKRDDLSPADFVELSTQVISEVMKMVDKAQDDIMSEVETLADSFGGSDFTLRQLKGE